MTERTALYARVSTTAQGEDGTSLDSQLEAMRAFAQSKGYEISAELKDTFSGAAESRPAFDELKDLVRDHTVDIVVVHDIDRLIRGTGIFLAFEKFCKKNGVRIEYVLGGSVEGPAGNLLNIIRAAIAEYERELIRERTVRGKRRASANGRIVASEIPLGYEKVDGQAVVFEPEAQVVRSIFERYDQSSGSIKDLVQWLNSEGIRPRRVAKWTRGSVYRVLSNEVYATGELKYGSTKSVPKEDTQLLSRDRGGARTTLRRPSPETSISVRVPTIISQELWDRVVLKRAHNATSYRSRESQSYLFSGRMDCACGRAVVGTSRAKPGGGRYSYLRCTSYGESFKCEHAGHYHGPRTEAATLRTLFAALSDEARLRTWAERALDEWNRGHAGRPERRDLLDQAIEAERGKLERLGLTFADGSISQSTYLGEKNRLEAKLAQLRDERRQLENGEPPFKLEDVLEGRKDLLSDLGAIYDPSISYEEANEAWHNLRAEEGMPHPLERLGALIEEHDVRLRLDGGKKGAVSVTVGGARLEYRFVVE